MAKTSWSKADEVAMLRSFVEKAQEQTDSYLGSLLSPALIDWFDRQARQDMDTDVLAYESEYRKHVILLQSAETRAERAETRMLEQAERMEKEIARRVEHITREQETRTRTAEKEAEQAIQRKEWALADAQRSGDSLIHFVNENEEQRETIRALEQDVLRLKARLFDLIEQVDALSCPE